MTKRVLTNEERNALETGIYDVNGTKYVSSKYIEKLYNLGCRSSINRNIRNLELTDIIIKKTSFIKESKINVLLHNSTVFIGDLSLENFEEKMKLLFDEYTWIKDKPETFKLFLEYATVKASKSRRTNMSSILNGYKNCIRDIFPRFNGEVYKLTDSKIQEILQAEDEDITAKAKSYFTIFIKFVRTKKECSYLGSYNSTSTNLETVQKNVYTKKEVRTYYNFVNDTSKHIEKAIESPKYAEMWFYLSMHFISGWRKNDILTFPKSKIATMFDNIDIYNIDLDMAQSIINTVNETNNFFANKTGAINKFTVNRDMSVTIATSILILERHYKDNDSNSLIVEANTVKQVDFDYLSRAMQGTLDKLPRFASKKANDSFLTYLFHSAARGVKNADIANVLVSTKRAHLSDNTIKAYIAASNKDGLLDDISYNLFRRGHFGWLFYSLLDIVIEGDKQVLSVEDKTKIIQLYQELYTPKNLEKISKYFLDEQNNYKNISLEIAKINNKDLKEILKGILNGEMPSRSKLGQCIYSKNCKTPNKKCNSCNYIIPKIYLLHSLNKDIHEIIARLESCNEYEIAERIRSTSILYKYMALLSQATVEFGKDYVQNFIDLPELETRLNAINSKILKRG